jgi:hypothetical protein
MLGAFMAVFNACTEPRDFAGEIHAVDSLHVVLERTEQDIDSIELIVIDTITAQLKYIQENFIGPMQQSMAHTLLRYGNIREKSQQLVSWKDSLRSRKNELDKEFNDYKKVLTDMATHDAKKREITKQYADSVLLELEDAQQYWQTKINEWIQLHQNVNNQWAPLHDSILFWTDSIQHAKRP